MGGAVDDVAVQSRLQPERIAAIELASGRRWSYAALDRDIAACVHTLGELGLTEGDRLAVFARNRVLLLILHAACARRGIIYVPLNWRLSASELAEILADADPALLVHDDGDARGLPGLALDDLAARVSAAEPLATQTHDGLRPSLILYSSGTTGRPKGAVLSERNIAETAINIGILAHIDNASRVLLDSPMFHILGLVTNVRPYWMRGGTVLVSDGFEAGRTLARIADPDLGVTHYFCVPAMAAMIRRDPAFTPAKMRGLTAMFTGGAPNPPADILAWLDDGIPMVNGWGMSENGTLIGMPIDIPQIRRHLMSAGIPTARVEVRAVDATGEPVPAGQAGELHVRGPNLAAGYWRRPDETAKAFLADGWFATGDIGVIDADGFVQIVDRKKDMFISGGENVYPAEIEAAVAEHPGIAECAVVGMPDDRWGEAGHLFIVALRDPVDVALLRVHLEARLARYKLPKQIVTLNALPRNGAGKVVKAALKERVERDAADGLTSARR